MITYTNFLNDGRVEHRDENGDHVFASKEEFENYKKEKYSKYPVLCETCECTCAKDCPMDRGNKNGMFGKAIGCTYYNKREQD